MKVTFTQDVQHGTQVIVAGTSVDVDDTQAQAWIDAGVAVSAEPAAKPAAETAKKPIKAPAQG